MPNHRLIPGRQPKSIDLIQNLEEVSSFVKPLNEVRVSKYSALGKYFAYTQPDKVVIVHTADGVASSIASEIDVTDTFDLNFSPNDRYVTVWTKPILEDRDSGKWLKNVHLYDIETLSIVTSWSNKHQAGWLPQFTKDGLIMAKGVNNKEIHFYEVSETLDIRTPSYKYKAPDGLTIGNFLMSPGLNPAVAVFLPEKNGQPAQVFIYQLPNFKLTLCSKLIFKAEKCLLRWNALGTALLALALTDHDTTNKLYYGQTQLFLLGIVGSYERIDLKSQVPIHDITWLPTSREFAVSYGYMPSETTFFDARGNLTHLLPEAPRNTIIYSPNGRFVLVAGFGNLQGNVDVYDRQNKLNKVCSFEAANTSVCEWSPCGRFILTATTSPRLRVDNGLKIWHASGKLVYYREYPELLAVAWKPQSIEKFPPLKQLEEAPEAHASAKAYLEKRKPATLTKSAGAYRPPHARNSEVAASTTLAQIELQRAAAKATEPSAARKTVPGMPVAAKKKPVKRKVVGMADDLASETKGVSLEEKKIRALLKKLRAIETLKTKQALGEALEDTQVSKINKETEIRSELAQLGWSAKSE